MTISEAATIKSRAQRLLRDMTEILKDKTLPDGLRKEIEDVRGELRRTWADLEADTEVQSMTRKSIASRGIKPAEAVTKSVSGVELPASAFLVVEDPESPDTWHLPVKDENGNPDHRKMGAAWAALTVGYRGKKYAGPNKADALAKLKALYKAEDMEVPTAAEMAEWDDEAAMPIVPMSATSFAQLDTMRAIDEVSDRLRELTHDYQRLVENILYADAEHVPDKIAAFRDLSDEFVGLLDELLNPGVLGASESDVPTGEVETAEFAETFEGAPVLIAEGDAGKPDLLYMDVQIIQPGWGNTRDNNFYPREMLGRSAAKFAGVKMYETDHREGEKSTRTWVSTITEIKGFTETGAPIARVAVHDPDFAQRVRNLNAGGDLLHKMECSILASGVAKPNFELGGRKGKIVEEITEVTSVDWVTKAGAGGHAMALAESDEGTMTEPTNEPTNNEPTPTGSVENSVENSAGNATLVNTGVEDSAVTAATGAITSATTIQETEPQAPPEPVCLSESEVTALLEKANLPKAAKERLAAEQFESAEALEKRIAAEVQYIKEVSGSGRPFGLAAAPVNNTADLAEVEKRKDAVNKKYLGRS